MHNRSPAAIAIDASVVLACVLGLIVVDVLNLPRLLLWPLVICLGVFGVRLGARILLVVGWSMARLIRRVPGGAKLVERLQRF